MSGQLRPKNRPSSPFCFFFSDAASGFGAGALGTGAVGAERRGRGAVGAEDVETSVERIIFGCSGAFSARDGRSFVSPSSQITSAKRGCWPRGVHEPRSSRNSQRGFSSPVYSFWRIMKTSYVPRLRPVGSRTSNSIWERIIP